MSLSAPGLGTSNSCGTGCIARFTLHACLSIPNFLVLEFFEPDESVFHEIIDGGLRRDKSARPPSAGPGLGVRISDEFLRKHRFDETRTREMERRTFNTMK